jgi:S-adenosylmethionine/arginine decarboxylase-like enzyme
VNHKHLLISSEFTKTPFIDTEFTKSWIRDLVKKIDMKILYSPRAVRCDKEGNEGISAFCLITTSHICLHSWEKTEPNLVQLDVYSCKDYDKNIVIKEMNKFKPLSLKYKFIDRLEFDEDTL